MAILGILDRAKQFGIEVVRNVQEWSDRREIAVLAPGEEWEPSLDECKLFDYSQLASERDIQPLVKKGSRNSDFYLGKYLRWADDRAFLGTDVGLHRHFLYQHVLLVDPTGERSHPLVWQSLANLLQFGNLIYVDTRGLFLENRDRFLSLAQTAGAKLAAWDVNAEDSERAVWNLFEELATLGKREDVAAIASVLCRDLPDAPSLPQAEWLTALLALFIDARRQKLMVVQPSQIGDFIGDRDVVAKLLSYLPQVQQTWAAVWQDYLQLGDREFATRQDSLQASLSLFRQPEFQTISDGASDVLLLPTLNGSARQFLVIGQNYLDKRTDTVPAQLAIAYLANVLRRRQKRPQHRWQPTFIIVDDAQFFPDWDWQDMLALGREERVGILLLCRNIEGFSEPNRQAIADCRTRIIFPGTSAESARWLSADFGEYRRANGSPGEEWVPVLGRRELQERPDASCDRAAIVWVNAAGSPVAKPFAIDGF